MLFVQSVHAPAAGAPPWVRLLMMATNRLSRSVSAIGSGPRIVIAAPTGRHLPAAAALTAIRHPELGKPTVIEPGFRVATVLSRKFCDVKVSRIGERWELNGITFDTSRKPLPPLVVLSHDQELGRRDIAVPNDALAPMSLLGFDEVPEWTYQRLCLSPIVLLTHRPGQVIEDLAELAEAEQWWNPLQSAALVDPEQGSQWWFRRPVIVMTPAAVLAEPWLAHLAVSLVVVAGYAAWMSSARQLWSAAPQVLLLNQRSTDIANFRGWFDGTEFPALEMPFDRHLRQAGMTLTAFREPSDSLADTSGEVDEWEF